jgi:hypothetical protein
MTFKQKLASTLISEIEICRDIASRTTQIDPSMTIEQHSAKWRAMSRQTEEIACIMFGIDSDMDHRGIIQELRKFAGK